MMFKKILTYTGIMLLAAMAAAYFCFAARLFADKSGERICKTVSVEILDSTINKFVSKDEVVKLINEYDGPVTGKKCDNINLEKIELMLNRRSAIKESQVSLTRDGFMKVEITQRRPLLRIETAGGGFYIDEFEYIFPLSESFTSYVPVVSGHIPLDLNAGFRGKAEDEDTPWITKIMELGMFLNENPFWGAMIEQIYVAENGDVILSPKVGEIKIILGRPDDIELKFRKLLAFYRNIAPEKGWTRYSEVNLKYKGQIVCKLNNTPLKIKES